MAAPLNASGVRSALVRAYCMIEASPKRGRKRSERRWWRHAVAVAALCATGMAEAQTSRTIRVAGEEWPPFLARSLPDDGLTGSQLRAVLDRLGYTASIDYYPWRRAMELGMHDPRYAGFMPVLRTPEREKFCHFSTTLGRTSYVLAYLRERPVRARSLADLRDTRIGTVSGYSYSADFDTMAATRALDVEEAVNDETNLRKLLFRRFPVIVIDSQVLRFLLAKDAFTQADRERIATSDGLFAERTMHLCFRRTTVGQVQQQAFDNAAREVDLNRLEKEYWRRIGVGG
ncbi:transporter substrate-binding domain-containing protein [Massilia buxea]|uniref:Transporter substrate-binding domain-containing protein n=2 Tax=Pseudoduganella buxea TaxID=1949069 RepID=A0A6I3SZ76_9BURK|nr:transporter substrate-binding domain-containing protein [Pseudoduganella buxea]